MHAANIAIIHPQLRDLVLPLARGHVLYPRGNAVEEARWRDDADDEDDDGGADVGVAAGLGVGDKSPPRRGYSGQAVAKTLFKIGFTPTCLTTRCVRSARAVLLLSCGADTPGVAARSSRAVARRANSSSATCPPATGCSARPPSSRSRST